MFRLPANSPSTSLWYVVVDAHLTASLVNRGISDTADQQGWRLGGTIQASCRARSRLTPLQEENKPDSFVRIVSNKGRDGQKSSTQGQDGEKDRDHYGGTLYIAASM
jgi:hypothetical protein